MGRAMGLAGKGQIEDHANGQYRKTHIAHRSPNRGAWVESGRLLILRRVVNIGFEVVGRHADLRVGGVGELQHKKVHASE